MADIWTDLEANVVGRSAEKVAEKWKKVMPCKKGKKRKGK